MSRSVVRAGVAAVLVLGASAAGAIAATPDAWPPVGEHRYEGTWTTTHVAYDGPGDPLSTVGETNPGVVLLTCSDGTPLQCEFAPSGGWGVFAVELAEDGSFETVDERSLEATCGGPDVIRRVAVSGVLDESTAVVTVAETFIPRTEENGQCIAWGEDETVRFEGTRVGAPEPGSGGGPADLETFLVGYGLECAGDGTTCEMALPDATYRVDTTTDEAGEPIHIVAAVTSADESMPSDAGGFLRGVAERAPVDDADALVEWFDAAIAGGEPTSSIGAWTATWSDTAVSGDTVWGLQLVRTVDPAATAAPPTDRAPAAPTGGPVLEPSPGAVPAPPVDSATGNGGNSEPVPFAASVPAPAEISTDPTVVLQSAILAALLVFLMPFPSQLFNSTLETHEDEVRRWLQLERLGAAARGMGSLWASWPGVILFTALAAVLYGFLDPAFGLNLGSLATFLGMLLGIVLVTVAFAIPTVLAHRGLGDRPSPTVVPVSLLIGVLCVLISRLTDFQPGYLYGLLIGLAFARELSAAEEGRTTAIGAALMLGLAFVAWLALGALPDSEAFGVVVARTTLAALMVAGLEGVVFGLLPMRFLPGEALYGWNRLLWAGLLLLGAFAFFHILINPASGYLSDTSRTPLFTVVALLVGFSLVSVAFWAWFRFRPETAQPPRREQEGTH